MASNYHTFIDDVDAMLVNGNVSSDTKKAIVNKLNQVLTNMSDKTSAQFRDMNELKIRVGNAPIINLRLRRVNLENSNLPDKLTLAYKALLANPDIDSVDLGTLSDPTDISSVTYLKAVKQAAKNNTTLTNSSKNVTGLLVPTTGISGLLSAAVISSNDCHKPNDIAISTTSFLSMTS